jgi:uncharacterized membrane protein
MIVRRLFFVVCHCELFSEAICQYLGLIFKLICINQADCFAEKARNDNYAKLRKIKENPESICSGLCTNIL